MNPSTSARTPIALPSDQDHTGRTLDREELDALRRAIESGTLTSTKGEAVKDFEQRFAAMLGVKHAFACSSGTAAIQCAVAALDPEPGDEFVTTSITDMGALTPILYQASIPVFADVEPYSCNVTARTLEERISDRTRALIVTHLFGNPCPMDEIMEVAQRYRLPVIEDCAQAFLAKSNDRFVGTIGKVGCFSLQQGKHITAGEGGIVVTNDDQLARRMYLFINKAWGYGDPKPDHYFLALNCRMTELQGAVAGAQLEKLPSVVAARIRTADLLTRQIAGIPGLATPHVDPGAVHTYWKYCLRVDGEIIPGGATGLGARLKELGIACAPRYIQKPAFQCQIFRDQKTFGTSRFPFPLARPEAVDYSPARYPGTVSALEGVLVLPWNERYDERHVDFIADSVTQATTERNSKSELRIPKQIQNLKS